MEISHIKDLTPDPKNARVHTERNLHALVKSLEAVGFGRSIVIDEEGRILCGNATIEACGELGIEGVRVVEADGEEIIAVQRKGLTEEQKIQMAVADNRAGDHAQYDPSKLLELADVADLNEWFFPDEWEQLKQSAMGDPEGTEIDEPDTVPEECEIEHKTNVGEIWECGRHRLAVGDCRDGALVEKLFNGRRSDLIVTDPPYGVDYKEKAETASSLGYVFKTAPENPGIEGDDVDPEGMAKLVIDALETGWDHALSNNPALYIWYPDSAMGFPFLEAMYHAGYLHHQNIIWAKDRSVFGRKDYRQGHESCWYGWKKGYRPLWIGNLGQQPTVWESPIVPNPVHPNQKPVIFYEKCILNHLDGHGILYDPFAGSGTALIAAEKTGRTAYAVELLPYYADCIIARFELLTGLVCKPL